MKKCKGCQREVDKYTIACQYCGKLLDEERKAADRGRPSGPGRKTVDKNAGGG